ncbi:unnamed protein product [Rhizophagus irregularis]|nr:unnamed protein product [Rhizophagus irregularis]
MNYFKQNIIWDCVEAVDHYKLMRPKRSIGGKENGEESDLCRLYHNKLEVIDGQAGLLVYSNVHESGVTASSTPFVNSTPFVKFDGQAGLLVYSNVHESGVTASSTSFQWTRKAKTSSKSKSKITAKDLVVFNENDYTRCGLRMAPVIRLMKFIEDNKDKILEHFF